MSVLNFKPTIWNSAIIQERDKMLVARAVCNTAGEAEVQGQGNQVIFPGLVDPTVNTYSGTVTYEDLDDAAVTLLLDQANYFAVKIDDVDAVQAKGNLLEAQVKRGSHKLAETADAYVLAQYGQANNEVEDTTCDTSTILSDISAAKRKLDEANVPMDGRWMVIAPWVAEKMDLAGVKFGIREGAPVAAGSQWASYNGFDVFVSNSVTNPTASGSVTYCLAGGADAIAYYDQLVKTKAESLEGSFAEGVKTLHVYGTKVVRPDELVSMALTYAAETAI